MQIEPISYLEWAKFQSQAKINLSRSGVPDLSLGELPLALELKDLDISGRNPYGYEPLIEAISRRYQVSSGNIVLTQGASQAIFMVCAALIERGDKVIVERPAYEPLLACPRFFQAEILRLERSFENKFQIDFDDLRKLLAKGTKLIILTNLHNPTGVLLTREELKMLAEEVEKNSTYLFIDEIYLEFIQGKASCSAFGLNDKIIVASSLTKVYGLGGLRCGWILAPPELARRIRHLTDYLLVEGVFIGESLAAFLFPHLDQLRQKNHLWIEKNHQILSHFMKNQEKLSWVEPDGGVVCFPRLNTRRGGDEFSQYLRQRAEISVVPGSFFGAQKHFRLGAAVPPQVLSSALEIINSVLKSWD